MWEIGKAQMDITSQKTPAGLLAKTETEKLGLVQRLTKQEQIRKSDFKNRPWQTAVIDIKYPLQTTLGGQAPQDYTIAHQGSAFSSFSDVALVFQLPPTLLM